jgi:hypothetical protein
LEPEDFEGKKYFANICSDLRISYDQPTKNIISKFLRNNPFENANKFKGKQTLEAEPIYIKYE